MGLIDIPNACPGIMSHINERLGMLLQANKIELPDFSEAESVFSVSNKQERM